MAPGTLLATLLTLSVDRGSASRPGLALGLLDVQAEQPPSAKRPPSDLQIEQAQLPQPWSSGPRLKQILEQEFPAYCPIVMAVCYVGWTTLGHGDSAIEAKITVILDCARMGEVGKTPISPWHFRIRGLDTIVLRKCNVQYGLLEYLSDVPSLQNVELDSIPTKLGLFQTAKWENMTSLTLRHCFLKPIRTEFLRRSFAELKLLDVENSNLSGPFPEFLKDNKKLTVLKLRGNQLTGKLPEWLGYLEALEELDLSHNNLSGRIPETIGRLRRLQVLGLEVNKLGGQIPRGIGNLTRLESMNLGNNDLTGYIPEEIGRLAQLRKLSLYKNRLKGGIPHCVTELHKLETLELDGNELTGVIPLNIDRLAELSRLTLNHNQLSGGIPPAIAELKQIEELDLHSNRLSGTIPLELGRLGGLKKMNLSHNRLTGEIPQDLRNLTNLQQLYLGYNRLSGRIPRSLSTLLELGILHLGTNRLTGEIPRQLGDLRGLTQLRLDNNRLTGMIPHELGLLHRLEVLSLGSNQLTGGIDADLGNLKHLEILDLGNNRLTGGLPLLLGWSLRQLNLSNNELTGEVPTELLEAVQTSLGILDLYNNNLTGVIPLEVGNLQGLEILRLGDNIFDGPIPNELGKLSRLRELQIERNLLHGDVPLEIGDLRELQTLIMAGNWLNGPIPHSFARLNQLRLLDLSDNNLVGEIPWGLSSLRHLKFMSLATNWLRGPIPASFSRLKSLQILDLSDNLLSGEIPPELSHLQSLLGLFLNRNCLTGTIPIEFKGFRGLSYLVLHENGLHGEVPEMHLTRCTATECSGDLMVLTLYGNLLSCSLPEAMVSSHDTDALRAEVAHGNKFYLPAPHWLGKSVDVVHFETKGILLRTVVLVVSGVVLWLSTVAIVLRHEAWPFIWKEVFGCTPEDREPEANAHLELIGWLTCMSLLAVGGQLPTCYMGSHFTRCGDEFAHISITYLARAPYSAMITVFLLIVFIGLVYSFIGTLPPRTGRKGWLLFYSMAFGWLCWLFVVASVSVLPVLYAAFHAMPEDNRMRDDIGDTLYFAIYYGAPTITTCINTFVLPAVAVFFSRKSGVTFKRLLTVNHIVCFWLAPSAVVAYMSEGCAKGWRDWWTKCASTDLNVEVVFMQSTLHPLIAQNLCHRPGWTRLWGQHNGGCTRNILEELTPMLLQSVALEALAFPFARLVLWSWSHLNEEGELELLGRKGWRTSSNAKEHFIQLDLWATTSILWGAVVPCMQPLLLLTVCMSFVNLRIETLHFGRKRMYQELDDSLRISRGSLRVSLSLLCLFLLSFGLESVLWGIVA